ncbi:MAG: hypothetical protein KBT69_05375 [Oceanihabitans sp.]|nr:hypothetical protein [Oceanihabitans sp.]
MELTIYTKGYDNANSINNFMDFYYSLQMTHLASDLLKKGLSPKQISDAVAVAFKIAKSSTIETKKHFMPVYSAINQEIIQDCKLSHLGYGLVLMNANPNLSVVGDFQVNVLKEFLKGRN